jgi:ABC-2 type transport system permease protein
MGKTISLYFMYISAILRSSMQYKISFLLMIIGRFLIAFNSFLGIYFLFSGFTEIKGYTYGDILLCFSVIQMSFSLSECIASGFCAFSGIVKRGEFDRILLRPCSPILQVLGTRFELGRIGPMITAVIMLVVGINNSHIQWTIGRVMTLLLMLLGGTLLFSGLFMIGATICFFSIEESGSINILTYGAKEHGKYPFDIYGKGMMRFCTFVVPYTLVQYYPLQFLLGKSDNWLYALYPLGTVIFIYICYGFWRFGMRHYQSSGS